VLAEAFLAELAPQLGKKVSGIEKAARQRLERYRWPGNVRELRNAIERAVILCDGSEITTEHLPLGITSTESVTYRAAAPAPTRGTLDATEREMIVDALARAGQNKSKAARLLGLTRAQLRSRIEKHGIISE